MWEILTVELFDTWMLGLIQAEQVDVLIAIKLLEVHGPMLARPHADSLEGTNKVKNLKELRIQHKGKPYRVFFAFTQNEEVSCYVVERKLVIYVFIKK